MANFYYGQMPEQQGFDWGNLFSTAGKFAGPVGMGLGLAADLFGGLFGKSPEEERREWIENQQREAGRQFDRGLASEGARFATARMRSGVDREAALMRSRASGSASGARNRIAGALGLAGAGMAEGIAQGVQQEGYGQAASFLSQSLAQIDARSKAEAMQEAQGRQQGVLAGMYSQPLQQPSLHGRRSGWSELSDPLGRGMTGIGNWWDKYYGKDQA
jgi:hypothetical protein